MRKAGKQKWKELVFVDQSSFTQNGSTLSETRMNDRKTGVAPAIHNISVIDVDLPSKQSPIPTFSVSFWHSKSRHLPFDKTISSTPEGGWQTTGTVFVRCPALVR